MNTPYTDPEETLIGTDRDRPYFAPGRSLTLATSYRTAGQRPLPPKGMGLTALTGRRPGVFELVAAAVEKSSASSNQTSQKAIDAVIALLR
jgi:hypothetical protein